MKFYCATSFAAKDVQRAVVRLMGSRGHEQTFDWTGASWDLAPVDEADRREWYRRAGELDRNGVTEADRVLAILPGRFGMHVEIGLALGAGVPVVLFARPEDLSVAPGTTNPPFYQLCECRPYDGTLDGLLAAAGDWLDSLSGTHAEP